MFIQNDEIVVNSTRKKVTASSILLDLEFLNKYKEQSLKGFVDIQGMSESFIKQLETEFDITLDQIKEAIQRGKNYRRPSSAYRKSKHGNYYICERYVVNRQPRVFNQN